jgi:phenylalanyl-tRNA synthetase alpha chain
MNLNHLLETLHPLERKVLPFLKNSKNLSELERNSKLKEIEIIRALQWLENKRIIKTNKRLTEIYSLDKNGKTYAQRKLPEFQFLQAIKDEELCLQEIKEKANLNNEEANISIGQLKKRSAIIIKEGMNISITPAGLKLLSNNTPEQTLIEKLIQSLKILNNEEKKIFKQLQKRKQLVKLDIITEREIELTDIGKQIITKKIDQNMIETLTPAMLKNNSWRGKKFRRYDIKINVPKKYPGKRHFVNQAKQHAKRIWLDMGFEEMTGTIINSSFWNFDALFTAQDHPVREMQDTFFLKGTSKLPNKTLVNKIKKQHESSWKYDWKESESKKPVLRTHTTVLSAQTISKLKDKDLPKKYFALGRNYRNEALDWSHLFEFNQTEGIVIDPKANFKHLLGYLKQFFHKMGYEKVRFRPAYFPYTEPSVEIDVFVEEKDTWIELGGAGIFRPEVIKPLFGKDIPVLAWGPGFDRILMNYYQIKDIRNLYKNDLKQLKEIKEWV